MVNLWSPGCPPCIDEVPSLVAFHAHNAANARVVGIAMDYPGFGRADAKSLAAFVDLYRINFPVLVADGERAGKFVGEEVDLIPLTLAYDPQGQMVARWHGVITAADINEIIRDFTP
jgi:thiol-disulfide isomerase/thioredoxin